MRLHAAQNGDDRTQSPAPISRKREFSWRRPETFGNFDPQFTQSGARRRPLDRKSPLIVGLSGLSEVVSLRPHWLAGVRGFELTHFR